MDISKSADEELENALFEVASKLNKNVNNVDDLFPSEQSKKNSSFQCNVCSKVFTAKNSLVFHLRTHLDPANRPMFECTICSATFKSKPGLKYHLEAKHVPAEFKIEVLTEETVELQEKDDNQEDDYFSAQQKPAAHPFQCTVCGKILKTKQSLKFHQKTHIDPENRPTFKCEICSSMFKSQLGLTYHLETKHTAGSERKKLPCSTCGRIFKSAEGRKIHMTIQHGADGPIFKCKECPMVFARKPHLDLHMTTHGSGLHVCTICGKNYARLKDLSRHEASCGVKELICDVCGKQFRQVKVLENHRKKMHLHRAFRCLTCGQGFATGKALESHEAVHRRTFCCGQCTHTFGTVEALRNHEQTKHWEQLGVEPGPGEKRGRPKKDGSERPPKVRMRRSKYDMFIGLEHLADPSTLIEEEKPAKVVKVKLEGKGGGKLRRFPCELCPLRFVSLMALENHKARRHWEILGIERRVEHRGPPRKRPLVKVPKKVGIPRKVPKKKGRPPKVIRFDVVDPEKLIEEIREGTDLETPSKYAELKADNLVVEETVDPVQKNMIICETWNEAYIEKDFELITEIKKDEIIIKEEVIELETSFDEVDHFGHDHDPADIEADETAFGEIFGTAVEDPTKDFEPTCELQIYTPSAEEPTKEDHEATCEPQFSTELVIELKKLDYAALAKPAAKKFPPFKSRYKNPFPRKECEHCGKTFAYQYKLAVHRVEEHGSTETPKVNRPPPKTMMPLNYQCDQCDRKYHLQFRLMEHKAKVHGCEEEVAKPSAKFPSTHSCKICGKILCGWMSLKYHLKFVHEQTIDETQLVRCPDCRNTFVNAEWMAEHICLKGVVCERERPFKCNLCDKAYSYNIHLEGHFGVHPEYQNVKCDECPKGFYNEREMNNHKRINHGKPIQCPICNRMFKTKSNFRKHKEIHEDKEYFCEICGKRCPTQANLKSHKYRAHPQSEKARFNLTQQTCTICGAVLKSKSSLYAHLKAHDNDRRFKCSYCDKTFIKRVTMKEHEQSHTKDYAHKCKFCDYGTVHRNRIVTHEQREHNHNRFAEQNST